MNLDSFLHVVIISSICMMRQFVFSIRTDVLSSSEMTIVTTFNAWSRLSSILFHGRMSFWSFSSIPCVRTLSAVVENVYNVTHVVCVFLFTCQRRPDPFFPRLSKNCEERFFFVFFAQVWNSVRIDAFDEWDVVDHQSLSRPIICGRELVDPCSSWINSILVKNRKAFPRPI